MSSDKLVPATRAQRPALELGDGYVVGRRCDARCATDLEGGGVPNVRGVDDLS